MDDPRPKFPSDALKIFAVMEQGIHERAVRMAGRGMDHKTGRLVEHEDVGVLEQNDKRDILRDEFRRFRRRDFRFDDVVVAEFVMGFSGLAVDLDATRLDQFLPPGSGEIGLTRAEPEVQARPRFPGLNREFIHSPSRLLPVRQTTTRGRWQIARD